MGFILGFLTFVRKTITDWWAKQLDYEANKGKYEKEKMQAKKEYLKDKLEATRLEKEINDLQPKEDKGYRWGTIR